MFFEHAFSITTIFRCGFRVVGSIALSVILLGLIGVTATDAYLSAQSLHIFSTPDSLTLYGPQAVSLNGLQFGVIIDKQRKLITFGDSFSSLLLTDGLASANDCYVYRVSGTKPPLSQSCTGNVFRDDVAPADVFWYDAVRNQLRDLAIFRDSQWTGAICSASTPDCTVQWAESATPTLTPTLNGVPQSTPILPGNSVTKNSDWKPRYKIFNDAEMVLVPVGCFMMGSTDGQDDEKPVNQQCFDQPFWIDRFEVTNKQFGSEGNFKGDNRPRDSISWLEAQNFCFNRDARLPTEREWEYAARGPDSLSYPWGNVFVADNVVYTGNSGGASAEVGTKPFGLSWVGALDMSGNLWEWVSSIYKPYPYLANDGRESTDDKNGAHVLRGGYWDNGDKLVRAPDRYWFNLAVDAKDIGFRCVHSFNMSDIVSRNADWTPVYKTFNGVEMALVPVGCFMMGSQEGAGDEQPISWQCFNKPFWIDHYEMTQKQFKRLGGVKANADAFDGDYRPVENISWFEAHDFCEMRNARLPTEAEWEYAARGPDDLIYTWGNEWNPDNLAWKRADFQGTDEVTNHVAGASWVGALDLNGNVWEYVNSLYMPYPYDANDGREVSTGKDTKFKRVLRGSSWAYNENFYLRTTVRGWDFPDGFNRFNGFRCARDFQESDLSN